MRCDERETDDFLGLRIAVPVSSACACREGSSAMSWSRSKVVGDKERNGDSSASWALGLGGI